MFFYLKISSKDERILKKFVRLLAKLNSLPIMLKSFPKHKKKKVVTVLKSPHVNKTAQEQFGYRLFFKHFLIRSFKPFTFLLLLKKLKNTSFPSLNLEIKGLLEKNKTQRHTLNLINPDNVRLKTINYLDLKSKQYKTQSKKTLNFLFCKKYIQLFDLYGEVSLKNTYHWQK